MAKKETQVVWKIQEIPKYMDNQTTMGKICVWWKGWSATSPV
jgi:hypothetical protein